MTLIAALSFENSLTDEFVASGTYAIRTDASPAMEGTYALRTAQNWPSFVYYEPTPINYFSASGCYVHCLHYFTATPTTTGTIIAINDGNNANPLAELYHRTDGKTELRIYTDITKTGQESVAGTYVLAINTKYRIELWADVDNGSGKGYAEVKIKNASDTVLENYSITHSTTTLYASITRVLWGCTAITGASNTYKWFDNLWVNDDTGTNNGWPGNLSMTSIRPNADSGTNNTWRGKPDNTTKYTNVDEVVADTTTEVRGDQSASAHKQTFGLTDIATGKTIRAVKLMVRAKRTGTLASNAGNSVVRDNATDYATNLMTPYNLNAVGAGIYKNVPVETVVSDFGPQYFDTRPSGGGWTNAIVSALELGGECALGTALTQPGNPKTPDIQQQWTPSTAGNHWPLIDNYDAPDTADYIESSVLNDFDIFTVAPVDPVGYLYATPAIQVAIYAARTGASNAVIEPYIRIGGTDYAGATMTVSSASPTYAYYNGGWTTNPATGVAWLSEDFATIQAFGLKHLDANAVRVAEAQLQMPYQPIIVITQAWGVAVYDDVNEPGGAVAFVPKVMMI